MLRSFVFSFCLLIITPTILADSDQAALQKIIAQIVDTERENNHYNTQRASHITALEMSESTINLTRQALRRHRTERRQAQSDLSIIDQQLSDAQRQITHYEQEIADIFQSLWANRSHNGLTAMLSANKGEQQRQSYYYHVMNEAQQAAVTIFRTKALHVTELKQKQLNELATINQLTSKIERELASIETEAAHRNRLVQELDQFIDSNEQKLQLLKQEEQQLNRVIAELERAIETLGPNRSRLPFHELKGQLSPPISGDLVNRFNQPRRGSVKWKGFRYLAQPGTEISAVAYGRVVYANWLSGQGLLIAIDHDDDYLTLYAHNQSIFKRVGEWVEPGEVIAEVGNTGGQSEHALYFEIRHRGVAKNPSQWLK